MRELSPGLLRWEVPHPDWKPESDPESTGFWPREVGCVAIRGETVTTFVDPLAPADWSVLDAFAAGCECVVVTTIAWHARDRGVFGQRYGARLLGIDDVWPSDVVALPVPAAKETLVWVPAHATLIPGDVLIGDGSGGLRVCPQSWLDDESEPGSVTVAEIQATLFDLIPRPVAQVLVSHWSPVLHHADALLDRALSAPRRGGAEGGAGLRTGS